MRLAQNQRHISVRIRGGTPEISQSGVMVATLALGASAREGVPVRVRPLVPYVAVENWHIGEN